MSFIIKQPTRNGTVNIELVEKYKDARDGAWKQRRQHLGVLSTDGKELLLCRDRKELTPEILFLLEQKEIKYSGRNSPSCGRRSTPSSKWSTKKLSFPTGIKEVGETRILRQLCDEAGLTTALISEDAFGLHDGLAVLYLAIWQACTGDAQYLAADWFARREIAPELNTFDFSSGALSTFMKKIFDHGAARQAFYRHWIRACGMPSSVIYDTTVFFTHSHRPVMAEYGYDHGHAEGLPQFNFTMVLDAVSGLPLTYRLLPGSVTDVTTMVKTSEALREYGLRDFMVVVDKGFHSNGNMAKCLDEKIRILCGVPFSSRDAKSLRDNLRSQLEDSAHQVMFNHQRIGMVAGKWIVHLPDESQVEIEAWLVRNFSRMSMLAEHFLEKLDSVDDLLAQSWFSNEESYGRWLSDRNDSTKALLKNYYVRSISRRWILEEKTTRKKTRRGAKKAVRRFLYSKTGLSFSSINKGVSYLETLGKEIASGLALKEHDCFQLTRNATQINEAVSNLGLSLYVTTEKMDRIDFLKKLRGRESIEEIFDLMKNDNGQERLRSGCSSVIEGRFFLAFLAGIVREIFGCRFRATTQNRIKSINDALRQLQLVRVVEYSSGKKSMVEIPKKTRDIMQAMKIALPEE